MLVETLVAKWAGSWEYLLVVSTVVSMDSRKVDQRAVVMVG